MQLEPLPEMHAHPQQLRITGLMGGHSGLNISEDRGNAVLLAAHILQAVFRAHPDCRLISFTAGDKRNAIAREASAVLLVSSNLFTHVHITLIVLCNPFGLQAAV